MDSRADKQHLVIRNSDGEYSIWRAGRAIPQGWTLDADLKSSAAVEDHLSRVWPYPTKRAARDVQADNPCPIVRRFRQVARRSPDALASLSAEGSVTYSELDAWSDQIAGRLRNHGARVGNYVAIVCQPSSEGIAAVLGVLKSGAAFVPIDPIWPEARKIEVTRLIEPVATIVADQSIALPAAQRVIVSTNEEATQVAQRRLEAGEKEAGSNADLAYVIFTSGSTGSPRGVAVQRDSLWHYCEWASGAYPGARRSSLLYSSLSFDLSVTALFVPLMNGGTVFTSRLDMDEIERAVAQHDIGFLKVTPSQLPLLEVFPRSALPSSDLVIGGEQLFGASVPTRVRAVNVVNEYGPTEATVGCVYHELSEDDYGPDPVPIGAAAPGVRVHVLTEDLGVATGGHQGELYVSGPGIARGYHNDPVATASRFVADPFGPPGSRMYKTGDMVSARGGRLTFLGRTDSQLKVAGFRIEPFEIETTMTRIAGVGRVHVEAWGAKEGRKLIAYFCPNHEARAPTPRELRRNLSERLPGHMVPSGFVRLDEFPVTSNGKIDTQALPAPDFQSTPAISGFE